MNTQVNTTVTTNLSHLTRFTIGLNHHKLLTGADDQNNKVNVNILPREQIMWTKDKFKIKMMPQG